jgi:hypothetical protein
MRIRVFTFEGCPNAEAARDLVEKTVHDLKLSVVIEAIQVMNEDEAIQYAFLGSPSIQIDGRDIEPSRRSDPAAFACRVYRTSNCPAGVPPRKLLLDAIREAQSTSR